MLYRKEANSRDRKSNIEKRGGGSIVEMRKEICLKYSNMAKCLDTFVTHCVRVLNPHSHKWDPGVIKNTAQTPRSYVVAMANGSTLGRNRRHIRPTGENVNT